MTTSHIVITGAGHAGVELSSTLRTRGFDGRISLLGDDRRLPNQRPPLSKAFLTDGQDPLPLRSASFFADNDIDLRPGTRVSSIDRDRREVVLADGAVQTYSDLVLATGVRTRTFPFQGLS